ncbi:hypothetical protein [Actinomadura rugatobispora]|uniref:Enoyl-CoA hydratase/isomerase family protein n=1 Tax=Actinomadura rugatobispora TaxID=1994 RepID=A0ABW0ZV96_9ACTN|nr:hypothetical protein GCM10010200_002150 [Actinomadura rugatobispora]
MSGEVLTERIGGVPSIVVNRPEVRNAINAAASVAIAEALDELDNDPALAVGVIEPVRSSENAREGALAFKEKRTPHWKGH